MSTATKNSAQHPKGDPVVTFTKNAWKKMLKPSTVSTATFREIVRVHIGQAISEFYEEFKICPKSVQLSEISTGSLENQLVISIQVAGKSGKKEVTHTHKFKWVGVKLSWSSSISSASRAADIFQVDVVSTGASFKISELFCLTNYST